MLCNGVSNYVQGSLDVHQDATPPRGMAAAQPLTATRHNSLGQDVDESAVQAVSAVQGRGRSGPMLNPGMARGYHAPGVDVQQGSSELMVNWRLSRCRLCRLRMAVSLGTWVRAAGLIRPFAGAVVLPGELEEVRQYQVLLGEQPTLVVGPAALGTVQQLHQPWGKCRSCT